MARNIVKAKLDIIFKKLFTDDGDNELLIGLLDAILELPEDEKIADIQITKNELMPDSPDGKVSRLDLNVKLQSEKDKTENKYRLINVEIQLNQRSDYAERALFYWSKLFTGSLKSGDAYSELPMTISLNILGYSMFPDREKYHSIYLPKEEKHNDVLTDKFSLQFFELEKLNHRKTNLQSKKERWLRFLNAETEEELDMLETAKDSTLDKAITKLKYFSENEQLRFDAISREKYINDQASLERSAMLAGRAEGEAVGLKKGRAAERAEIIAKMKKKGLSDDEINAIMDL